MPALFGRPINLYWDGRHIPGLLALAWKQIAAVAVGCHRGGDVGLVAGRPPRSCAGR